jgi:predicted RND superfamily exporter protein
VQATLYDKDPDTGETLDYHAFSLALEEKIRDRYQSDTIKIRIIGVAKIIGDLTDAGPAIAMFFLAAIGISFLLLVWYTRCIISTLTLLICAVTSVIWQLGILQTIGMPLSAYSSLVPFLIFAISISHGIQNVNTTALNMAEGDNAYVASQKAFLALYVAGMTALLGDGVGFITLWIIDIPSIKDLAIAASIGIAVIIFTKLILFTIIMSYFGVTKSGIRHFKAKSQREPKVWRKISNVATPKVAAISIAVALIATVTIHMNYGINVKIGDLDTGAPELHPDSRYNLDNKYIADNYFVSSDMFVVMVKTTPDRCFDYENVEVLDRFAWTMENVEGVQSAVSMAYVIRQVLSGLNEGSLKWDTLPRDQQAIDSTAAMVPEQMVNNSCSFAPLVLFLSDHKAETLSRVTAAARQFIADNPMEDIEFQLATGNAGIEAATNEVIKDAYYRMLLLVYVAVSFLVYISFNSIRATACIILPLIITSILGDSLMAYLGIGIKVATLPVVALGVGIGVDYSIYLYAKMESYLQKGYSLIDAYFNTLKTTGNAIVLTALTLTLGVVTWIWSPIKFQTDMGILLTFMFLWNMIGAIWLLPALCCFLIKPERVVAKKEKKELRRLNRSNAKKAQPKNKAA